MTVLGMIALSEFSKHSLFGGFLPQDIDRISHLFAMNSFDTGDFLIREGDPNDSMFFLMSGEVKVTRGDRELITFKAGDCFGEIEMLDTKPAAASIQALSPCSAACLDHKAVHKLFHVDAKLFSLFMMNLARDLARRLRRMDELL